MPRAIESLDCDKDVLLAAFPCIHCLSEQQLLAVLALAFCKFNAGDPNAVCDPAVLLEDAACFTCMTERQMLEAFVALVVNWGIEAGYLESETNLRGDIGCMICLSKKQILAILLKQTCDGIAAGNVFCAPA